MQMIRAFLTKKKYFYQISILGGWNLVTIKVGSINFRTPRITSTGSLLTNCNTRKARSSSLSWRVELEFS